jgi:hypothetical protein
MKYSRGISLVNVGMERNVSEALSLSLSLSLPFSIHYEGLMNPVFAYYISK